MGDSFTVEAVIIVVAFTPKRSRSILKTRVVETDTELDLAQALAKASSFALRCEERYGAAVFLALVFFEGREC